MQRTPRLDGDVVATIFHTSGTRIQRMLYVLFVFFPFLFTMFLVVSVSHLWECSLYPRVIEWKKNKLGMRIRCGKVGSHTYTRKKKETEKGLKTLCLIRFLFHFFLLFFLFYILPHVSCVYPFLFRLFYTIPVYFLLRTHACEYIWVAIHSNIQPYASTIQRSNSVRCRPTNDEEDEYGTYTLTFNIEFNHDNDTVYFAHSYPYTYSDLQVSFIARIIHQANVYEYMV